MCLRDILDASRHAYRHNGQQLSDFAPTLALATMDLWFSMRIDVIQKRNHYTRVARSAEWNNVDYVSGMVVDVDFTSLVSVRT